MFAGPLARVIKLSCTLNRVYPVHNIGYIHEETYFKYQSPYYGIEEIFYPNKRKFQR